MRAFEPRAGAGMRVSVRPEVSAGVGGVFADQSGLTSTSLF